MSGPAIDSNGEIKDLNIPGIAYSCSAETRALCGDMTPGLYMTYKNEGMCWIPAIYTLWSMMILLYFV
jgi:hypothetical protein